MSSDLADPMVHDEDAARAHLEGLRWATGVFCPHCGSTDGIKRLEGKSHRAGLHQCNGCREHFTVTVGTVMDRSHIPLAKWMLGITHKSAWFMSHRIRKAMTDATPRRSAARARL